MVLHPLYPVYILHDGLSNKRFSRAVLVDSLLLAGVVILAAACLELIQAVKAGEPLPRVRSILENPNPLATVLLILTPLATVRCLTLRGWLRLPLAIYAFISAGLLFF
jgi:hypothetical protein